MLSFTRVSDSKLLFRESARTFSPESSGAETPPSSVTFDFTSSATKLYGMGQNRQDQNGPGMGVNVVGPSIPLRPRPTLKYSHLKNTYWAFKHAWPCVQRQQAGDLTSAPCDNALSQAIRTISRSRLATRGGPPTPSRGCWGPIPRQASNLGCYSTRPRSAAWSTAAPPWRGRSSPTTATRSCGAATSTSLFWGQLSRGFRLYTALYALCGCALLYLTLIGH